MGPRGAIHQTGSALGLDAPAPFPHRLDGHAERRGYDLGRQPLDQHPTRELGSTTRRKPGIVMDVHSVPLGQLKIRNLSFLGRGRMDNLLKAHILVEGLLGSPLD
jgi:hypothetical protein